MKSQNGSRPMRLLQPGERVRLDPAGDWYTVERVTPCSATLRAVLSRSKEVTVTEKNGEPRTFTVTTGGKVQVSPRAFVEREKEKES